MAIETRVLTELDIVKYRVCKGSNVGLSLSKT